MRVFLITISVLNQEEKRSIPVHLMSRNVYTVDIFLSFFAFFFFFFFFFFVCECILSVCMHMCESVIIMFIYRLKYVYRPLR